MPGFNIHYQLLTQTEEIQCHWQDLQARAECSYFQSWGWIQSWLNYIVDDRQVWVLQVWSEDELLGLGLFVPADIRRRLVIRSKALFLNEYPFAGKNMVIEYNGILAARGFEQVVHREVVNYLVREQQLYDEFHFGGLTNEAVFSQLARTIKPVIKCETLEESVSWQVEFDHSHRNIQQMLASLSKNRRGQIRRSMRLYEEQGPLKLEEAETLADAMDYFNELGTLHTQRWQTKGKPGVFKNPAWKRFHTHLIASRFNEGEIQLIKVSCGGRAIGYLYNHD